ncbi:MAG: ABC transporter ATP-binding protein [Geminicoccaceae bacterium]
MAEPFLDVRDAVKVFGGLSAVDGVSFGMQPGERLGIAGPNGSGKSTLFNLITGVPFGPTSGEVRFQGQRIDCWPAHRIARAGLMRTFQKDAEFPDLDARDTVGLASVYAGSGDVGEALDLVAFDEGRRSLPTSALSVYEKKQLMIASAIVARPRLLMLDEPASGLTRPEIEALDALLLDINRRGVAILLIEHVLGLLLSVSERLIVLNQGSVLAEGNPDDVVKDVRVIEAYLGGSA